MDYAVAFIFIQAGFYLRHLFFIVFIAFDQGMDKGPGSCSYNNYNWCLYRDPCCSPYFNLLSCRYHPQKKPDSIYSFVACYQQHFVPDLFIPLYNKY
jgi:hypothetical protein